MQQLTMTDTDMSDTLLDRLAESRAILWGFADAENLESLPAETVCRALTGVINLLDQADDAFTKMTSPVDAPAPKLARAI
jgi:hypothetical protein